MKEKTLVKICGLRRPSDAQAVNRVLPDFAGFILSPGFRRSIGLEQAVRLRGLLDPRIRTVGVYVDADPEEIIKAAASGAVNLIQLHGKEDDEYIERIILRTSLPVIKAFRIGEKSDLEQAVKQKGLTIVAVRAYIADNGYAKLRIALAKGKKEFDKRQTIKDKDIRREMERS